MSFFSTYSLKKSTKQFYRFASLYHKYKETLTPSLKKRFLEQLKELQNHLKNKDKTGASKIAKQLEVWVRQQFPKSRFYSWGETAFAIFFALIVATLVRQEWFEFYKIPSGSMRPTLKEGDLVAVSKSSFAINVPLTTSHLYWNADLFQRGNIVVFSGSHLDISDNYTTYFFLFPGVKQYVKRLIGKPGDTLYFYGGFLYGIDQAGKDIPSLRESNWFQKVEHIPFLRFPGKVENTSSYGKPGATVFYQMNEPLAKLAFNASHQLEGSLLGPYQSLSDYGDIWGIDHFAMVRLLTSKEKKALYPKEAGDRAPFYLELLHHPSIHRPRIEPDEYGVMRPSLSYETSILPVYENQLHRIKKYLSTSRFSVKQGKIYRYGLSYAQVQYYPFLPKAPSGFPEGTYEWDQGVAYQILPGDIAKALPSDHPIYQNTLEWLQLLFNLGVEWDTHYAPSSQRTTFFPARYSYFREGDLYLMGHPIFFKEEENLQSFVEKENNLSSTLSYYRPFIDRGPPLLSDGSIDTAWIQKYGLKIPDNLYLVLGDNHAMSADSRVFGFVPQGNFRGRVSFLFWPPFSRLGSLLQPIQPFFTAPHLIIWGTFGVLLILGWRIHVRRKKRLDDLS